MTPTPSGASLPALFVRLWRIRLARLLLWLTRDMTIRPDGRTGQRLSSFLRLKDNGNW